MNKQENLKQPTEVNAGSGKNSFFLLDQPCPAITVANDKKYNYSITINISPKKSVMKHTKWGTLCPTSQKSFLNAIILSLDKEYHTYIQYVFETCENGMIHLHGRLYCEEFVIAMIQIKVSMLCGFPRLAPHICCFVERTKYNITYWHDYMHKGDRNVKKILVAGGDPFYLMKDENDKIITMNNPLKK